MDIILTNSLLLVPKENQDIFIKLCNTILNLNIPVKDLILVINMICTNSHVYMLLDKIKKKEKISEELLQNTKISIFKEIRTTLSTESFKECAFLLHPVIEKYFEVLESNKMVRKMLFRRHRAISNKAKELKLNNHSNLNDLDIWLLAEKELMSNPKMYIK